MRYDFYLYECPDFFELPVDGDASKKKWVLSAADSSYAVGTFDGINFTPEDSRIQGQSRRGCFYAPQTFSDTPDGRRIQIGWGQAPAPGMPFNQLLTMPCELQLRQTPDGVRLRRIPVKELESLRGKSWKADRHTLAEGDPNPLANVSGELLEIRADFTPAADSEVTFNVRGVEIRYNAAKKEISGPDVQAPSPLQNGRQVITIFADRNYFNVLAAALHDIHGGEIDLTYIGAMGAGEILPIFHDALVGKTNRLFTLAQPAHTTCLEFTDGKVMLCDMAPCGDVTWERLLECVGEAILDELLRDAKFISAVNWGKLPHAGLIWSKIAERLAGLGVPAKETHCFPR